MNIITLIIPVLILLVGCSTYVENKIAEDFNILLNAKNLATSGVGTFSIAAALASKNLKNFYYSNLFFLHHLLICLFKFDEFAKAELQYIHIYLLFEIEILLSVMKS